MIKYIIMKIINCFKRYYSKKKQVYVLKLAKNKYYIGESNDVEYRKWVHKNEAGSAWTKKYNYIKQIQPLTKMQPHFSELLETLTMMNKYGIDNVRGSMFTNPYDLSPYEKVFAAQLYCELNNYCRKCGGNDHFITTCKSTEMAPWVNKFGGKLSIQEIINKQKDRKCLKCDCDISKLPINYRYCRSCFYKTC